MICSIQTGMKQRRIIQFLFSLIAATVACLLGATVAAQSVVFVDDDAPFGGDGTSWSSAFRDLQDALDSARANSNIEEIWVAGGEYFPDRGTGDRDATFALVSNVGVHGGFQGNEATRPPRQERTADTVLSGDIGVRNDPSDNSKTVVWSLPETNHAEIENFTVIHGNGTWGSGINIRAGSYAIRLVACRFRDNRSIWGGGVLISNSDDCVVIDCDFDSNIANHGGAIYLANIVTTTEIVNCRFYNNHAYGFGGAVANSSSHPIFRNCTFFNNRADREGGALSNSGGTAQFFNSILWQNAPFEIRDQESDTTISYSCITGGWDGVGNIDIDPKFVDANAGDLRLAPNSPCIDAGDNDALLDDQTLDLDFNPRKVDDLGTADTGNGNAPIVDMGCYEFQGTSFATLDPLPGDAGRKNRFRAIGATPGERIWFIHGRNEGSTPVPGCPDLMVNLDAPKIIGSAIADADGRATIDRYIPDAARGMVLLFQGVNRDRCAATRTVSFFFD